MELEFIQNETGKWVAEFQVTSDFNLHLDNVNKRSLKILQRTQGNGYGIVADTLEVRDYTNVYDCDFTGLVYPKFIKIESVEKPIGIITTDGEVTEIKSQSKEVEIVANGVTEIAPDNGFGYLSGVKVNINVPQSGGGESGGGSSLEYINFEGVTFDSEQIRLLLIKFSYGIKYNVSGQKLIVTTAMHANPTGADLYAIAIDFSFAMGEYGDIMSLKDYFAARLNFDTDNLPRITKEEFYTL